MLAQNFKPAADLSIAEDERDALIKVLGILERGELQYVSNSEFGTVPNGFNMSVWCCVSPLPGSKCGTTCCLGGWVQEITGIRMAIGSHRYPRQETYPMGLLELFYAEEMNNRELLKKMTDQAAALALRNFLTTGRANWAEVLKG